MLKLYHFLLATCGTKVRFVLAEKGMDYEECILDPDAGDLTTPEYLKLNPNGVVPTLVHDDHVITESSVIMNYLEDLDPESSLRPPAAYERAKMNTWMKLADEKYLSALGALTYATLIRPKLLALDQQSREEEYGKTQDPERRSLKRDLIEQGLDSKVIPGALKALDGMLDRIENSLAEGEYLAGVTYSLADAAIAPFVYRLSLMNLLQNPETQRPALLAWWDRIQSRPSYDAVIRNSMDSGVEQLIRAITEPELPRIYDIITSH
ncbi:MAG: glutathione S-transferase family protein [Pseudomonadota bacterium]|nr:glutathione S-transferase family protein [Pseudomonadota bacterium]